MNRWPMTRIMLTAHVWFALIAWMVLMVVAALVTGGIAIWGNVDQSVWHYIATQVSRWLAVGLGFDAISTYLRMHVAHGRTRRDFLRQFWVYVVGLAVAFGVLLTIGYLVERGVYALVGWPHKLQAAALFDSSGDVLGIFGGLALMMLLWTIAGAMVHAAFTRNVLLGIVTIPVGLLLISPTELLVGANGVPIFRDTVASWGLSTGATAGIAVACVAVGCATTWGIVRDIPMRPRVT